MSFLKKIFGDPSAKEVKKAEPLVLKTNEREGKYQKLSDSDLRDKTDEFRRELKSGKTLDDILPDAFACVREAAKRVLGQRHFDVQITGGIILHRAKIAEMKTGEGKTLVSTLPLYLNALSGRGVHLVTVNDYLARRDCGWMGQVYHFLGLKTGCIINSASYVFDPEYEDPNALEDRLSHLRPVERDEAYKADITYGTNNEFGFDYLRDNMAGTKEQQAQKKLNYAIIDEVDSVLVDEARTPLIISAPAEESADMYYKFARLIPQLGKDKDYNVDEKMRAATLTDEGIARMEKMLGVVNIYEEGGITMVHHIEQALRAHTLFQKDKDYVVKDGEIIIVDEFTGRLMHGRRYSEGLHQAIEAKENVEIRKESKTMATITFQNYFRLYNKIAGMTGTAKTEEEEFIKIYNLEVVVIPTNRPLVRKDAEDHIYKNEKAKFDAVVKDAKALQEKGQPVLIGTVSIEKNEKLSALLRRNGVRHEVLNAKNHEREALIFAEAGKKGQVTVATNMAGRGVDIVLGGSGTEKKEQEEVKKLGGLHVIGTERHESRRIDNQLRGRAGRQGDPGSTQFYVSLEDDLMRLFGSERVGSIMERLGLPDDQAIEHRMISKSLESAQKKVEGHNFDTRKHLLEYDDVINKQRTAIYKRRQKALESENLKDEMMDIINAEIEGVVLFHCADTQGEWNIKEITEAVNLIFPYDKSNEENLKKLNSPQAIIQELEKEAESYYEKREKELGPESMRMVERAVLLRTIDSLWVEHLEVIDYLRTGIGLRGYGQRDPLVEFKQESHVLYEKLLGAVQNNIVHAIFKVSLVKQPAMPARTEERHDSAQTAITPDQGRAQIAASGARQMEQNTEAGSAKPVTSGPKVGRNDPCPCGSGKKYKKCHGR